MRKEPAHRSEMTSQVLFGEGIQVIDTDKEWLWVKGVSDGYEGWITEHLVSEADAALVQQPAPFVTTGIINQLEKDGDTLLLPMGCSLPGFQEHNKKIWNGFTCHGNFRDTQHKGRIDELLSISKKWLHAPYLWGGRTFMGVDCSGFIQTVFKIMGLPLLRDAWQQEGQGDPVPELAAAIAGDVAFFRNEAGRIVHVGLLLEPNRIIHASGTVRIDALTSDGILHSQSGKQTHTLHSIRRMFGPLSPEGGT